MAIRTDTTTAAALQIPAVTTRDVVLKASFDVCSTITEITSKLDTEGSISSSMAEAFLKRLRDWSTTLPTNMRHFSRSADELVTLEEQERTIGNIHVSCVYYFAVMFVTRPFLVTHLMAQMTTSAGTEAIGTSSTQAEIADLAQACIDSAMLMAKMSCEALQSGILLKQMCVLK